MKITSAIEVKFYYMYFVSKQEREHIQNVMQLTDNQYINLVKHVKKMKKPELSHEILELLLLQKLYENADDLNTWKFALDFWKWKHKIPQSNSDDTNINLGDLLNGL